MESDAVRQKPRKPPKGSKPPKDRGRRSGSPPTSRREEAPAGEAEEAPLRSPLPRPMRRRKPKLPKRLLRPKQLKSRRRRRKQGEKEEA